MKKPELKLTRKDLSSLKTSTEKGIYYGRDLTIAQVRSINSLLWDKYEKYLSADSYGGTVAKGNFMRALEALQRESAIGKSGIRYSDIKAGISKYELSGLYMSKEQRFSSFTIRDIIEDKEDIRRFAALTREKNAQGRMVFTKYDPYKLKKVDSGNFNGKSYTVQRYGDKDVYLLVWQSPNEVEVLTLAQGLDRYAPIFNGLNNRESSI